MASTKNHYSDVTESAPGGRVVPLLTPTPLCDRIGRDGAREGGMVPQRGPVFLLAPAAMQATEVYTRAFLQLTERHADEPVVRDKGLFESPEDRLESYREVLHPATRVYILTARDGTVGREVFEEWEYLVSERGVPGAVLVPAPEDVSRFEEYQDGILTIIDPGDWERHAAIRVWAVPGEGA